MNIFYIKNTPKAKSATAERPNQKHTDKAILKPVISKSVAIERQAVY